MRQKIIIYLYIYIYIRIYSLALQITKGVLKKFWNKIISKHSKKQIKCGLRQFNFALQRFCKNKLNKIIQGYIKKKSDNYFHSLCTLGSKFTFRKRETTSFSNATPKWKPVFKLRSLKINFRVIFLLLHFYITACN